MVDRDKELLAKFKTMMENDYRIPCNSISIRNPEVNAIVGRVRQTIGNIICTFKIQEMDLDNEKPLGRTSLINHVCHTVNGAHYYAAYIVTTGIG